MCRYVFTRGNKSGENCHIGGKDKYRGYCKRHFERHFKSDNDTNETIFNSPNVTIGNSMDKRPQLKEKRDNENDPFLSIINKYQPQPEPEPEPEFSDLYKKYKEGCSIKNEDPIEYAEFDESEYLKQVGDELNEMGTPKFDEEFIKNSLFNLNLVAFTGIEQGSQMLTDLYPDKIDTDLTGLTRDVYEEEELYKEVLYEVYKDNSDVIDQYLSPVAIYGLLVVKSVGVRYGKNKKKT